MRPLLVAAAALVAIAIAFWQINGAAEGLEVTDADLDGTPVTVFGKKGLGRAPAVVVAHGFAGSQQLMHPFAVTLAQRGYRVFTFDFPGHGRHPGPVPGGLADHDLRTRALLDSLHRVASYAAGPAAPGPNDGIALLGHSMASEIVVRYGRDHPDVKATIAVSLFFNEVSATSPRNLLVIDGALEPELITQEGLRILRMSTTDAPWPGVTYGDFAEGTARRLVLSRGVEHIGVLFSEDSLREAGEWLDNAFGMRPEQVGPTDRRGLWLPLLFAALAAIGWPLSLLLPRLRGAMARAPMSQRRYVLACSAPAVLVPLALRFAPKGTIPLLVADYLLLHFALYGAFIAVCARMVRAKEPAVRCAGPAVTAVGTIAPAAFAAMGIGLPVHLYAFNLAPTASRLPYLLVIFVATLLYFLADERWIRSASAPKGAYFTSKLFFVLSLLFAVLLNLERLFFLVIILPAVVVLFVVYGLFCRWLWTRTGAPEAGALTCALAFAWAMAMVFPAVTP